MYSFINAIECQLGIGGARDIAVQYINALLPPVRYGFSRQGEAPDPVVRVFGEQVINQCTADESRTPGNQPGFHGGSALTPAFALPEPVQNARAERIGLFEMGKVSTARHRFNAHSLREILAAHGAAKQ